MIYYLPIRIERTFDPVIFNGVCFRNRTWMVLLPFMNLRLKGSITYGNFHYFIHISNSLQRVTKEFGRKVNYLMETPGIM